MTDNATVKRYRVTNLYNISFVLKRAIMLSVWRIAHKKNINQETIMGISLQKTLLGCSYLIIAIIVTCFVLSL